MTWHLKHSTDVVSELGSDTNAGLTSEEATRRLKEYGPNELLEQKNRSPFHILWKQLTATMVLVLLGASLIALVVGDTKNAIAIISIVALFAILGFIQEYRAEMAMAALKKISVPTVRVMRNGVLTEISSREIVPGDIIDVEAGNIIPADGRIIQSSSLHLQESALTGESEPVAKASHTLKDEGLPIGDRTNMGYLGTTVTHGRGRLVVTATGMGTELGRIAALIQQATREQTPLQERLDRLGKHLAVAGVFIAGLVLLLGLQMGDSLRHVLLLAVSIAVAIVPEGLPAVVTITLALGAQRMLRRNALIRKLPAVETLGSVTTICTDKTGTLTENVMTVTVLKTADEELRLLEVGRTAADYTSPGGKGIKLLLIAAAACNDANLAMDERGMKVLGDPTEGAILAVARDAGIEKEALREKLPRLAEIPFDSARKRMTTFHRVEKSAVSLFPLVNIDLPLFVSFTKGSVDGLLDRSDTLCTAGTFQLLDEETRERIMADNDHLARRGMRVLGVACRLLSSIPDSPGPAEEVRLVFLGMVGMIDPPREEARDAVRLTRTAGIRTVMITGDHPLTAAEIGSQLNILDTGRVLTGRELDKLSSNQLEDIVEDVRIFARVSPEHKLAIVQALQHRGHVVSMTGDGVNDAPALKRADIGIAMGITGTDVAKEASDLVLLDDNFATIVAAVREGRTIYDNIRKFVRFSVAGNTGKVLVMLCAPFLGMPIPLEAIQLLWLNLLTDGLLGLGLGVEPSEKGIMSRPPSPPGEGVFTRRSIIGTGFTGLLVGVIGLAITAWYYHRGERSWQTMAFTVLAFAQAGQALAVRTGSESIKTTGLASNPVMLSMVLSVIALQLIVIYVPPLQELFHTIALHLRDLVVCLCSGAAVFGAIEYSKGCWKRAGIAKEEG